MTIADNLLTVHTEIQQALQMAGRTKQAVKLIAVTKGRSVAMIQAAIAAGQIDFGENYLQEALKKIAALQSYSLQWHFIGPIQSNKTRYIAENFSWVHTVSREKVAERLNEQRPAELPPLNVCIQINISQTDTRSGLLLEDLPNFLLCFKNLTRLKLRGLMAIPLAMTSEQELLRIYGRLAQSFWHLQQQDATIDTLSIGMSDDFELAIRAGSTMVRIGRAIFAKE